MLKPVFQIAKEHPLVSLFAAVAIAAVTSYKVENIIVNHPTRPDTSVPTGGITTSTMEENSQYIDSSLASQNEVLKLSNILSQLYRSRDIWVVFEREVQLLSHQEQQALSEKMLSQWTFYLAFRHIKAFDKMKREEFLSRAFSGNNQIADRDVRSILDWFLSSGFTRKELIHALQKNNKQDILINYESFFLSGNWSELVQYDQAMLTHGKSNISPKIATGDSKSPDSSEHLGTTSEGEWLRKPSFFIDKDARIIKVNSLIKDLNYADAAKWLSDELRDTIFPGIIRMRLIEWSDYLHVIEFAKILWVHTGEIPQLVTQFVRVQLPRDKNPQWRLRQLAKFIDHIEIPPSIYQEIIWAFEKMGNIDDILYSKKLTDYYAHYYTQSHRRDWIVGNFLNDKYFSLLLERIDIVRPTQQQLQLMLDFALHSSNGHDKYVGIILRSVERTKW